MTHIDQLIQVEHLIDLGSPLLDCVRLCQLPFEQDSFPPIKVSIKEETLLVKGCLNSVTHAQQEKNRIKLNPQISNNIKASYNPLPERLYIGASPNHLQEGFNPQTTLQTVTITFRVDKRQLLRCVIDPMEKF